MKEEHQKEKENESGKFSSVKNRIISLYFITIVGILAFFCYLCSCKMWLLIRNGQNVNFTTFEFLNY
jgi:hypothetical protein